MIVHRYFYINKKNMRAIIILSFLFLAGCSYPGYNTVPEKMTLGFPIWFGGPSMSWKFEPKQEL